MMELPIEIVVKCNTKADYDKLSEKLNELGYVWGVSKKLLTEKCLYPRDRDGFTFTIDTKKKHTFNSTYSLTLHTISIEKCIELLESIHIYGHLDSIVDNLFKEIKTNSIFKKGNLVTAKEKPFELVILVTKSTGRHPKQFTGVIVRNLDTSKIGDAHDTFEYKDFELIADMELSLKVKFDEEN